MSDLASRVVDLVRTTSRPYAVFVSRNVDLVPADGRRFARLQADPVRMAQCVGVFDQSSMVVDVALALDSAGFP